MDRETLSQEALDTLLASFGGDVDFFNELLETYFEDSPTQLKNMREAYAAGDQAALHRAVHSLKSNSNNFGAVRLANMCAEFEDRLENDNLEGAENWIQNIHDAYTDAETALKKLGS